MDPSKESSQNKLTSKPPNSSSIATKPSYSSSIASQPTNSSSILSKPSNSTLVASQQSNSGSVASQPSFSSFIASKPFNSTPVVSRHSNSGPATSQPSNSSSVAYQRPFYSPQFSRFAHIKTSNARKFFKPHQPNFLSTKSFFNDKNLNESNHLTYWANNPGSLNGNKRDEEARLQLCSFDKPEILFFAETWFNMESDSYIPGYQLHRLSRGGGVSKNIKKVISSVETGINQLNCKNIEQIWRIIK